MVVGDDGIAEVAQFGCEVACEQHVASLDVAMDDTIIAEEAQTLSDVAQQEDLCQQRHGLEVVLLVLVKRAKPTELGVDLGLLGLFEVVVLVDVVARQFGDALQDVVLVHDAIARLQRRGPLLLPNQGFLQLVGAHWR